MLPVELGRHFVVKNIEYEIFAKKIPSDQIGAVEFFYECKINHVRYKRDLCHMSHIFYKLSLLTQRWWSRVKYSSSGLHGYRFSV